MQAGSEGTSLGEGGEPAEGRGSQGGATARREAKRSRRAIATREGRREAREVQSKRQLWIRGGLFFLLLGRWLDWWGAFV